MPSERLNRTDRVRKTPGMLEIEGQLGEPIETVLRRLYYQENLTLWALGERLGINYTTAWQWLRRCGIAPKKLRPPASSEAVA